MSMYDVVYIDAHGQETPVAQQLDDRQDAAEVNTFEESPDIKGQGGR